MSGDLKNPNPSGSTSSVPEPDMDSPFFAWSFSSAKIRSCFLMRLAFSTSFAVAISMSSLTCRFLRSDKCIGFCWVEEGETSSVRRVFKRPVIFY